MKLDPTTTALIVIDIQVDFCSPDGISAKRGRGMSMINEMLPRLMDFAAKLKQKHILTVYTQFVTKNNPPANFGVLARENALSPICLEGTSGVDLYKVVPGPDDYVIQKEYYDCFAKTDLKAILQKNGIENILITGVRTDICVDTTAKRAFAEGFNVFVIQDLVANADERKSQHEVVLEVFKKYHGFVVTSEEALKMLS